MCAVTRNAESRIKDQKESSMTCKAENGEPARK